MKNMNKFFHQKADTHGSYLEATTCNQRNHGRENTY